MSKVQERRRATTDRIVSAAAELLSREGVRGLAMRELADHAECSVGTLYNLFGGADDVVAAVNERTAAEIDQRMQEAITQSDATHPVKRLNAAAEAYVRFAFVDSALWEAAMSGWGKIEKIHDASPENRLVVRIFSSEVSGMSSSAGNVEAGEALFSAIYGIVQLMKEIKHEQDEVAAAVKLHIDTFSAGYVARAAMAGF